MTLNGVMAVTLRYFTEVGKPASVAENDLWRNLCKSLVFLVRVQCRRKESSRSLSHLLMSFLLLCYCYSASAFVICAIKNYLLTYIYDVSGRRKPPSTLESD